MEALLAEQRGCLFMVIQSPEMNRVAATKTFRNDPAHLSRAGVHVIAMTANAVQRNRSPLLADGMDDFAAKPSILADLEEALERFRALRSGRRSRHRSPC